MDYRTETLNEVSIKIGLKVLVSHSVYFGLETPLGLITYPRNGMVCQ